MLTDYEIVLIEVLYHMTVAFKNSLPVFKSQTGQSPGAYRVSCQMRKEKSEERQKMERGFAIYETPVGWMRVEYENGNITRLGKIVDEPEDKGSRTALTDEVDRQLREYFDGKRKEFEFPYEMKGTVFQKSVWRALCAIPYGETRSYKDIAVAVGNAKASRAVGMANNKNPIAIVVPCHRVIGADGKLVGYASGLEMKEALLKLEAENK